MELMYEILSSSPQTSSVMVFSCPWVSSYESEWGGEGGISLPALAGLCPRAVMVEIYIIYYEMSDYGSFITPSTLDTRVASSDIGQRRHCDLFSNRSNHKESQNLFLRWRIIGLSGYWALQGIPGSEKWLLGYRPASFFSLLPHGPPWRTVFFLSFPMYQGFERNLRSSLGL